MKVLIVLLLIATLSLVAAEPSPLTAEENEKLLAALVQHYQARAALLDLQGAGVEDGQLTRQIEVVAVLGHQPFAIR